ncbi:hypothetical protein NX722_05735 [Endozoicomonas gorgoniicola]|uniref:XRE family transcriptional regulator n=1 Tax=Endozoicomonas gorgoniicola TaxID=1234144 RepID=A0ABT3MS00_9GAMM|nr:hypothetical protein [Endozoicomonas gorgoniicola]MCW7552154.1 hypothetical protein [Endozoicomonas gorgoniicola]
MKPDCSLYNPDAMYLRDIIEKAGFSQRGAAKQIGIPERTMRDYLNPAKENSKAPYVVQFALECLARTEK